MSLVSSVGVTTGSVGDDGWSLSLVAPIAVIPLPPLLADEGVMPLMPDGSDANASGWVSA